MKAVYLSVRHRTEPGLGGPGKGDTSRRAGGRPQPPGAAPADAERRDDHGPTTAGARARGALPESPPAAVPAPHRDRGPTAPDALPAWPGRRRLRPGPARPPGRGRPLVGQLDRPPEGELAGRVRRTEDALAGGPGAGGPLGDGLSVKARAETDTAAMLPRLAGLRDGRKVLLAVESGYRESPGSWATLLRDPPGPGPPGRRRRPPRDLGDADGRVPDGPPAAEREPPDPQTGSTSCPSASRPRRSASSPRSRPRRPGRPPSATSRRSRRGAPRRA